jgi:hypothetical protein
MMKEEKYSRDVLIERMLGELRKAYPDAKISEKGQWEIEVKAKDGNVFGGNFYTLHQEVNEKDVDYEQLIKDRVEVIKKTTEMGKTKFQVTADEVRKVAALQVKNKDWMSESPEKVRDQMHFRPFVNDMIVSIVLDYPKYCMYMTDSHIKTCGLTLEEIEQIAMENNNKRDFKVHVIPNKVEKLGDHEVIILVSRGEPTMYNLACTPKRLIEYTKGKKCLAVLPFRNMMMISELTGDEKKDLGLFMEIWTIAKSMIDDKLHPYEISEKPFVINENGSVSAKGIKIPGMEGGARGVMIGLEINKLTGEKKIKQMMSFNDGA